MSGSVAADRPVIDFLATLAERGTTDLDQLDSPGALAGWVRSAGLLDDPPAVADSDLGRARELRETLYRLLRSISVDGVPDPGALALINAAAVPPGPVLQLDADGRPHRTGDLRSALAGLARDGLDLVSGPDRERLSWCAGPRCTRAFIDRSRARNRRWCDMAGCGDRAKVAAYRQRQRS